MLAHQGGWDELLLAAGLVLATRFRRRAATTPRSQPDDVCAYCGEALEPHAVRCPSCGFRAGNAAE